MKKNIENLPAVTIYTDGACSGNPGEGGWAAYLEYRQPGGALYTKKISGYNAMTTNNIMELTAVVKGLEMLKIPASVRLHSDSAYVVNALNKNWLQNWQSNGWINAAGKSVANRELWEGLAKLITTHAVEFVKVKGHSDNEYNNLCDALARKAIADKKGVGKPNSQ